MKTPSKAAREKAREILRKDDPRGIGDGYGRTAGWIENALALYIDEVSEKAKGVRDAIRAAYADEPSSYAHAHADTLKSLILPDEPDPLKEIFTEHAFNVMPQSAASKAAWINAKLKARGLKIVDAKGEEPETIRLKVAMTRDEQMRMVRRALDEGKTIKIVEATDD